MTDGETLLNQDQDTVLSTMLSNSAKAVKPGVTENSAICKSLKPAVKVLKVGGFASSIGPAGLKLNVYVTNGHHMFWYP